MKGIGRVGDTVFSKRIGQKGTYAGIAGGPTKNQVDTLPQFVLTRENNKEFSGVQLFNKTFHALIISVLALGSNSAAYMRLMTRKLKVIQLLNSTALRGQRGILHDNFGNIISNFNLNLKTAFYSVFVGQFTNTVNVSRNSATISFNTASNQSVVPPKGATHFQITGILCVVADVIYDAITGNYVSDPSTTNNGKFSIATGAMTAITDSATMADMVLTLDGSPIITTSDNVMVVLTITYYQMVGSTPNRMFGKDSSILLGVY